VRRWRWWWQEWWFNQPWLLRVSACWPLAVAAQVRVAVGRASERVERRGWAAGSRSIAQKHNAGRSEVRNWEAWKSADCECRMRPCLPLLDGFVSSTQVTQASYVIRQPPP
jgi:hypothetical protein